MALNSETKNINAEKIDISKIYVNTAFTTADASSVQWEGKLQPYYDQLDNTSSEIKHQKAKSNEYSQRKDRQDPTNHIYENNDQSIQDVLQEMEINHLESKLPIVCSSKQASNRHFKIGIGLLAASCCILVVALTSVAVIPSARSLCEDEGCLNNGICNVVGGNIECACHEGFGGSRCEESPCENGLLSCQNGGECYVLNLHAKCACLNGFSGENCSLTPCSSDPCKNNGKSTHSINSSQPACECGDRYSGNNCQDYMCDFETTDVQSCVFEQECVNALRWQRTSLHKYAGHGPDRAANGGYYYLLSAGFRPTLSTVRLVSRNISLDTPKCLLFKYHLYGSRLRVYTNRNLQHHVFGSQIMSEWQLLNIQVPIETNKITFEVTFGYDYNYPYVSLDSVTITDC